MIESHQLCEFVEGDELEGYDECGRVATWTVSVRLSGCHNEFDEGCEWRLFGSCDEHREAIVVDLEQLFDTSIPYPAGDLVARARAELAAS